MVSCAKLTIDVAEDDRDGAAWSVLNDVVQEFVDFREEGLVVAGFEAALGGDIQDDESDVLCAPFEPQGPHSARKCGRGGVHLGDVCGKMVPHKYADSC
jgi:hypothetical protein